MDVDCVVIVAKVGGIVAGAGEGMNGPGVGLTCLDRGCYGGGGQNGCGGDGSEVHG